jgi:phosphoglycerate dehydrogenase-like enzyme
MVMLKGLYILATSSYEVIYGEAERADIVELVEVYAPQQTKDSVEQNPAVLHEAEVILSGWGAPLMDEGFLAAAPKLRAVFYGAGSIRGIVTEAFWDRGILISSAWAANAEPVAEFTVAQVFMCLKRVWQYARDTKDARRMWSRCTPPGSRRPRGWSPGRTWRP